MICMPRDRGEPVDGERTGGQGCDDPYGDHTRVATLQWSNGASGPTFKWDGMNHAYHHHAISHNATTDAGSNTGIAGADIFKMNADNKAIEHWEVLQIVGTPENSAPWLAPNLPVANSNGIF